MDQSSPSMCHVFEAQIRECYGRVVYTHKTHEKRADQCEMKLGYIKFAQLSLSALVTGGLVGAFFDKSQLAIAISALFSTSLTILTAYTKNYNLGQIAQDHKQVASKLWNIRESYLSLLTDLKMNRCDIDSATKRRDKLQAELAGVYTSAPRTNDKAYKAAQNALKNLEDMTFSDAEIDAFLPGPLKKITK